MSGLSSEPFAHKAGEHSGGALDLNHVHILLGRMGEPDVAGSKTDRGNAGGREQRGICPAWETFDRRGLSGFSERGGERAYERMRDGDFVRRLSKSGNQIGAEFRNARANARAGFLHFTREVRGGFAGNRAALELHAAAVGVRGKSEPAADNR